MKRFAALCCLLAAASIPSLADSFIYGNNASFGTPYIYQINKTTGAITNTYSNLSGSNGRGVVVVGTTMYYTSATTNSVFSYNLATNTDNGSLFHVAGTTALSTIAYDGTNFWIGDYSGSNHAYLYTPTGTLLRTISLSNCGGNCDGLEYFVRNGVGYLIENRGDAEGPYDVYDLNGNLVTSSFIAPAQSTTGIAFDGTNFFTSNIFAGSLSEWDINGNFVRTFSVTGGSPLIEDLSADYSQVLPPPPSTVPEPNTLFLLGTGVLGAAAQLRRKLFSR